MNDLMQKQEIRKDIFALEAGLKKVPGAFIGDNDLCPLKHSFAHKTYIRQIFIPKGTLIVGKIHRHSHANFLLSGDVSVMTEEGPKRLKGPLSMVSPAGTKRVVYAHEDTIWITVHVTNKTNLKKIENEIIAKTYSELPGYNAELLSFVNEVKGD